MRSAKEQDRFPYNGKTICYILVDKNGGVSQVAHTDAQLQAAYDAVVDGKGALYAVWPGQYRSDLFAIDDMDAFADAVGVRRETSHIHEVEWKISEIDDGVSRYARVDCRFKCGCDFDNMSLKKFANDMREQKGWVVATSTGCGRHMGGFTVSVARNSLK